MGFLDKAKDKAQELIGGGKEAVGDATGNESLQAEGTKDKTVGQAKGAGEDLKEKAAETFNDAKENFDNK